MLRFYVADGLRLILSILKNNCQCLYCWALSSITWVIFYLNYLGASFGTYSSRVWVFHVCGLSGVLEISGDAVSISTLGSTSRQQISLMLADLERKQTGIDVRNFREVQGGVPLYRKTKLLATGAQTELFLSSRL